jgi:tetratricopeptide (TPR) repeat protein
LQIKLLLSGAFLGLAALAFAVVFLLPSQVAENREPQVTTAAGSQTGPSVKTDTKPQENHKPKADKLMSEALRRLARLESAGVRTWGTEPLKTSLPVAEKALSLANGHYDQQRYARSLIHFQEAITAFAQLDASRPERFQRAMKRGRQAFDSKNAKAAAAQFTIAIAIEAGSAQAGALLARAKNLPEVLSLIARGTQHQQNGDLDQARRAYQAAVLRDPLYGPAKAHLSGIDKLIADRDYGRAVSQALVLLDKRDLKGASGALRRARKIRPNTPEVKDISRRIAATAQSVALDGLRKTANLFEAQERWADALALYEKALAIDINAAFADRGRVRARGFLDLHKAMDRYLSDPSRLHSPEPLAHAKGLLTQVGSIDAPGKILRAKRKSLQDVVFLAQTPISVTLRSDGKTEIVLYGVGKFGTFATRQFKLRPGKYVAAGSRPGFRDVRVRFEVSHKKKDMAVAVRCTEPIR